jgi:hypothetical protein
LSSIPSDQLQYAEILLWNNIQTPEAKWKINCIHNDPYPSALSTEDTPGLIKISKLLSDHLIKPHKASKINFIY